MDTLIQKRAAHRIGASQRHAAGHCVLNAEIIADALAVLMVDIIAVLPAPDRMEVLERLANRLDDRGRTPNGTGAAALLGDVSKSLMRMGL